MASLIKNELLNYLIPDVISIIDSYTLYSFAEDLTYGYFQLRLDRSIIERLNIPRISYNATQSFIEEVYHTRQEYLQDKKSYLVRNKDWEFCVDENKANKRCSGLSFFIGTMDDEDWDHITCYLENKDNSDNSDNSDDYLHVELLRYAVGSAINEITFLFNKKDCYQYGVSKTISDYYKEILKQQQVLIQVVAL